MKKPSPLGTSSVIALLLAGAASAALVACAPEPKKVAWSCSAAEVPLGEVLRCTQQAATSDGPATGTTGSSGTADGFGDAPSTGTGGSGTIDGFVDGAGTIVYECGPDVLNPSPDCPPPEAGETAGSGTTDGADDGSGSGEAGGGAGGIPTECIYVPELPYCGGAGGGTKDGSDEGGGDDGGAPTGKGNGNGNSSSGGSGGGGASSSGGSSGSGAADAGTAEGGGKGRHYTCEKDGKGNKSCTSKPECVPGTHPAKCGACVPDGEPESDCVPQSEGGCWVTGGGFIVEPSTTPAAPADGHDNFGGNAKPMKDGTVKGHWNHVDHGTQNHLVGRPEYIVCRKVDEPGPGQPGGKKGLVANQAYFGGEAKWSGATGYWFDVVVKDHGEPGSVGPAEKKGGMADTYHLTVRLIDNATANASGTVVYELHGPLEGGNIQMHAPNGGHPASTSTLPAWVSYEP